MNAVPEDMTPEEMQSEDMTPEDMRPLEAEESAQETMEGLSVAQTPGHEHHDPTEGSIDLPEGSQEGTSQWTEKPRAQAEPVKARAPRQSRKRISPEEMRRAVVLSEVLENPDKISQTVLNKGLDAGTAFEILSIDIADVDVGRNVGAQLQMDQAEADRRIAQAKAEEHRAMAVAHEQEMIAQVQEQRAKVVEAEAEVPRAMAEALRSGKMGVMDYYQMQNVISDTRMRQSIAGDQGQNPAEPQNKQ